MMVGLYYVIQEMGTFPMSVANNFCDTPLPKYLDSKTVLIYHPHPVCNEPLFWDHIDFLSAKKKTGEPARISASGQVEVTVPGQNE
jgi:hypothetical protein